MSTIQKKLKKLKGLVRNHWGYFFTTFITSALPILFLPVLTRYLEPSEYANIALFNFYFLLANCIAGTSLPTLISKNFFDQEKEYVAKIVGNAIYFVALISMAMTILLYLFSDTIKEYVSLPTFWIIIIPWVSFFFILFNMALTIMRNKRKVKNFSKHKIGFTVVNLLLSIVLVVILLWGWQGRVFGIVGAYITSATFALYYMKSNGYLSLTYSRNVIRKIVELVVPLIPDSFQKVIVAQVGIFFMQYYFTKDLLGLYSVGFQVAFSIKLLFKTLTMSWAPYLYEQLAKKENVNKIQLTRHFYGIMGLLVAGVLFINVFSGLILRLLTTPDYYAAIEFIPSLSIGFFFMGLFFFIKPVLIKTEQQYFLSSMSIITIGAMIFLNIAFIHIFGHIGIAHAFAVIAFIMFFATFYKAQKVFPLPWMKALVMKAKQ